MNYFGNTHVKIEHRCNDVKFVCFTECQDLIAQCLRIEPSQRILLEDILRHPWMRLEENCTLSSNNLIQMTSSASNGLNGGGQSENQHKPSLNSVGSCVSSSTSDECESSLTSPQHCYKKQPPSNLGVQQPRLRPPNSAPQTTSITKATWIAQPI